MAGQQELLDNERAECWLRYLEDTRKAGAAYLQIEPWAWHRLEEQLAAISEKRAAA